MCSHLDCRAALIHRQSPSSPDQYEDAIANNEYTRPVGNVLQPDGFQLLRGVSDYAIRVWEGTRGAEVAAFEVGTSEVETLCPLPDGRLPSGSRQDHTIKVWM
jgi:WD40 repeat protein